MRRDWRAASYALILALTVGGTASADSRQIYTYEIEHPRYGNIGTYTDTVVRDGDTRRIDTKMRIAVKVLGITMFREDADRTEIWRGGRLVGFDGVTVTNGNAVKVHGRARGDGFDITTPAGTTRAPAGIYPSTPWAAALPRAAFMMSTRSGEVLPAKEVGPEPAVISLYGAQIPVRHYEIETDKRQDVWLNASGIPVRFRTVEDGTPIDFVLNAEQVAQLRGQ